MNFPALVELIGQAVDVAGVGAIVIGIVIATIRFLRRSLGADASEIAYQHYRQGLGRALLLGLELLVAADIIRTVAIRPTFESVGILAIIVLIRTFLSWTLELELNGHWPWHEAIKNKVSESNQRD